MFLIRCITFLLLLLLLLSCPMLQSLTLPCPAPFTMQAGLCVFVSTAHSHTWCSANRQCASIGGELVNSYESIRLIRNGSVPSADCGSCQLWVGLSDLADERGSSRAGWQRVNGNGVMDTLPGDLFSGNEPSGAAHESCIRFDVGKLRDGACNKIYGFICEYRNGSASKQSAIWKINSFKKAKYNSDYCFTDVPETSDIQECTVAALISGNSRAVLYNSKLRACRLLLFTDAQVEEEIETSADWVKFLLD